LVWGPHRIDFLRLRTVTSSVRRNYCGLAAEGSDFVNLGSFVIFILRPVFEFSSPLLLSPAEPFPRVHRSRGGVNWKCFGCDWLLLLDRRCDIADAAEHLCPTSASGHPRFLNFRRSRYFVLDVLLGNSQTDFGSKQRVGI
jgi:hypothetical protein